MPNQTPDPSKPPAKKQAAKKTTAKKAAPAKTTSAKSTYTNVSYGDLNLSQFMAGLRHVENGGSYKWTVNSAGAHGAYQIVDWNGWARQAGVNPNDHSPAAQDRVAAFHIQQYLKRYGGNWSMVAAAWLGGPGGAETWSSGRGDPSDGNMSISQYVGAVLHAAGSANPAQYVPTGAVYAGYQGGGGTGTPRSMQTPNTSVSQYLDNPAIPSQYGYLAAYMKDPELGPLLARASKEGWGENQLLGALEKTHFWKTTAESARAWQAQQRLDPATARQRSGQMYKQIQQMAQATLGTKLIPKRASELANLSIAQGWSQAQLQSAIGAEFHYNKKIPAYGGAAGQTLAAFRKMANDYLVPVSDKHLNDWTRGVLEGTYQTQDFTEFLRAQAANLYPTLKNPLSKGVTVQQYLSPYQQMLQQTLGINPDGVDWMNPKWSKALNTTTPDGQRAPMSLSDWGTYLRGLPEYKSTDQATASVNDFAANLAKTFGKVSF